MFKIVVHNLDVVVRGLNNFGNNARRRMDDVLQTVMAEDVMPKWMEHVTLAALSLKDREMMGYPYSVLHGKDSGPEPDYDVHEVTGSLVSSSTVESDEIGGNPTVRLVNTSPHYELIRYGTRFMRPRDPGNETLQEALPGIKDRFASEIEAGVVELFES